MRVQREFNRSELEETVWFADKHFDDRASVRVVPKFATGNSETTLLIYFHHLVARSGASARGGAFVQRR